MAKIKKNDRVQYFNKIYKVYDVLPDSTLVLEMGSRFSIFRQDQVEAISEDELIRLSLKETIYQLDNLLCDREVVENFPICIVFKCKDCAFEKDCKGDFRRLKGESRIEHFTRLIKVREDMKILLKEINCDI